MGTERPEIYRSYPWSFHKERPFQMAEKYIFRKINGALGQSLKKIRGKALKKRMETRAFKMQHCKRQWL